MADEVCEVSGSTLQAAGIDEAHTQTLTREMVGDKLVPRVVRTYSSLKSEQSQSLSLNGANHPAPIPANTQPRLPTEKQEALIFNMMQRLGLKVSSPRFGAPQNQKADITNWFWNQKAPTGRSSRAHQLKLAKEILFNLSPRQRYSIDPRNELAMVDLRPTMGGYTGRPKTHSIAGRYNALKAATPTPPQTRLHVVKPGTGFKADRFASYDETLNHSAHHAYRPHYFAFRRRKPKEDKGCGLGNAA
ncbi:MAG: hypothetical protein PHX43_06425 [Alphaproteobacteria bacterium]|nr:hypothetical protein [Alphaproteobacteria bacterium]